MEGVHEPAVPKSASTGCVGGVLIPTTWFMALNPLLVVLLGSTVADLWRRRAEKSHRIVFVEKITVGLLLMSSSFLFMIGVEVSRAAGGLALWC